MLKQPSVISNERTIIFAKSTILLKNHSAKKVQDFLIRAPQLKLWTMGNGRMTLVSIQYNI